MESRPYIDLVVRTRRGDMQAFDELVERFQDMAVSVAWAQLRDRADAVDATQEAFVDALRKIDLLRDPAAFPGWLRSIVMTHCGRIRRHRDVASPVESAPESAPSPESTVADRDEAERLRTAVGGLPPHERVVVAMHYLGGCAYAEIADLLGISEEAARGRAHAARARLRDWTETGVDMFEAFGPVRPSRDRRFAGSTMLFAAIAREDVALARRILEADPALVEVEEDWDDATAGQVGLLPARDATPLVRAVARGNRALVELLLRHGADVDRTCGCAGGESPLWTASVAADVELVRLLLDAGADPNRPAFRGVTPLHVATMRGYDSIGRMLLEAGADPHAEDDGGRSPIDWAQIKDRALPGSDAPQLTPASRARTRWLETGIKAINLFAPLRQGALVRWIGPPGTGSLVVLIELAHNLARFEGLGATIVGFEYRGLTQAELRHGFAELDPATWARVDLAATDLPPDARRRTFTDAALRAGGAAAGHRRQLIVVAVHPEHLHDIEAETSRLLEAGELVVLLDIAGDATTASALPADATIRLDEQLARAELYPAIDPARTRGAYPDEDHARIANEARALLSQYRSVDPELILADGGADEEWAETARRLHRYLTQPFHTTEPFTGEFGVALSLAETVSTAREIVQNAPSGDDRTHA